MCPRRLQHSLLERESGAGGLFKPITTPACSPESNGMAEAFVNTIKRDSAGRADPSDSDTVPRQLPVRTEAYNRVAPHPAPGDVSPWEYGELRSQTPGV